MKHPFPNGSDERTDFLTNNLDGGHSGAKIRLSSCLVALHRPVTGTNHIMKGRLLGGSAHVLCRRANPASPSGRQPLIKRCRHWCLDALPGALSGLRLVVTVAARNRLIAEHRDQMPMTPLARPGLPSPARK